ncbi:uncharacterized protein LAESUDRAFT_738757 [Laetiporus sulphureus 93-53]|uniref:EthD domain-containing protein n=1 Tax=Laetiporus sulphureus 93-53 TaxID=1314785 RepID=A0A165CAT7_9APHY|nr:uncharacterized protein LAESUDRAFT_738757 [Laetiporus sulphureus 93-53]KZT02476.1 hypothetical protein LAESUDRAFT_738757 [Laetiporus sulphureus 93-53]
MGDSPTAFLLVFSEPGPDVSEKEYRDWYDNEHIPLRVNTPTFLNWTRWTAVDGMKPTYGASYDLESYAATKKPPYTTLAETRSGREKDILRRIQMLDRRHYELMERPTHPSSVLYDETRPAPYVVFVSLEMKPEYEDEFSRWYEEEHIPLLAKVPGWIRSRRFVLKDWGQMGVEGQIEQKQPPKYLATHEWESLDGFQSEEYKTAMGTSWRKNVLEGLLSKERRVMAFLRKWDRPVGRL